MTLLLLFSHLLLFLATFGPPYLDLALSIVLPPRYLATSAPYILRGYLYYIPTMAFNGVLEAFFASTATPDDLRKQSRWLLIFSVCFVGSSIAFSQYLGFGDAGLVMANTVNLLLRAKYAWNFIQDFFARRHPNQLVSWSKAFVPMSVMATFVFSTAITRISGWYFKSNPLTIRGQLGHITIGVGCIVGTLFGWYVLEWNTHRIRAYLPARSYVYERKRFQQTFKLLRSR